MKILIIGLGAGLLAMAADSRLADAVERSDRAAVRSLIAQKADVNAAQGDGMTALHWAAFHDDLESAKILVSAGANVKAATRDGAVTPLFIACTNGNAAMIEIMLKAGADANTPTADGSTALIKAAVSRIADAVKSSAGSWRERERAAKPRTARRH